MDFIQNVKLSHSEHVPIVIFIQNMHKGIMRVSISSGLKQLCSSNLVCSHLLALYMVTRMLDHKMASGGVANTVFMWWEHQTLNSQGMAHIFSHFDVHEDIFQSAFYSQP